LLVGGEKADKEEENSGLGGKKSASLADLREGGGKKKALILISSCWTQEDKIERKEGERGGERFNFHFWFTCYQRERERKKGGDLYLFGPAARKSNLLGEGEKKGYVFLSCRARADFSALFQRREESKK